MKIDLKLPEGETKVSKAKLATAILKVPKCVRTLLSSTIITENLDDEALDEAVRLVSKEEEI